MAAWIIGRVQEVYFVGAAGVSERQRKEKYLVINTCDIDFVY